MMPITSRRELGEWLKDKPTDWAQVIAASCALYSLPYALGKQTPDTWVEGCVLTLFRAVTISWAASNYPAYNMEAAARTARDAAAAVHAAYAVAQVARTASARSAAAAVYAVYAAHDVAARYDTAAAAIDAAFAFAEAAESDHNWDPAQPTGFAEASDAAWMNVYYHCSWLENLGDTISASRRLTGIVPALYFTPMAWRSALAYATTRLLTLDPTYQVWIDWYNRRIEGHDAAFDIAGDIDRVHDKAILARLADATDADFWSKGATYVNTTLQGWIDEARLTAELESIVRRLEAGAATQFGSLQARETLAAFRAKLEAALGNQVPAHTPIGHNRPPEGIDPAEVPLLPPALREEARAMLVTLDQPMPNSLDVAKTLTQWSRLNSTFQHEEFSKNFSGELGTSAARGIVFILTTLCLLGLAWLKAVLGI
jgi:hypothetical protein